MNELLASPKPPVDDELEEESKPNAKDDVEWELELTKKRTVELEKELENLSIAGNMDENVEEPSYHSNPTYLQLREQVLRVEEEHTPPKGDLL